MHDAGGGFPKKMSLGHSPASSEPPGRGAVAGGCTGSVRPQRGEPGRGMLRNRRLFMTQVIMISCSHGGTPSNFHPQVDTGFQHRLFLLPTSIFIQLVQNQGCNRSRLDAEWARAAPAPSKTKGDAAILTHTA